MITAGPKPLQRLPGTSLRAWARGLAALATAAALLLITWTASTAAEAPPRHTVQPGETLTAIAQQYGSTVDAMLAANQLANPDAIAVGQTLVAPAAAFPLVRVEAQPRDTIASLAQRLGVPPADLQAINRWQPGRRLAPGQDLLAPAPAGRPSPALPPGPILDVVTSPAVVRQGETVAVRLTVDASQPLSASLSLGPQVVPLRPAGDTMLVGLVAVHALTEPGYTWLDLAWQPVGEPVSRTLRWPLQVVDAGYPTYDIVLPPDKGDLLAPDVVQAELERMTALWSAPTTARRRRRSSGIGCFCARWPTHTSPARPTASAVPTTAARSAAFTPARILQRQRARLSLRPPPGRWCWQTRCRCAATPC